MMTTTPQLTLTVSQSLGRHCLVIWFMDDGFFGDYEPYKDKFKRTTRIHLFSLVENNNVTLHRFCGQTGIG